MAIESSGWLRVFLLTAFGGGFAFGADNPVGITALGMTGSSPCSDAIQLLIDQNPNREIFFPDGIYLLDKPIKTPANPKLSVTLRLSSYAHFKAVESWTNAEAMVRLGGKCAANDIETPGSMYSISGGIIDGSGKANGISVDSGRETVVKDLSIKATQVGLHIKRGANNGSSDCDIMNVNIVGNGDVRSVGVIVDGCDNTFSKMRIAKVMTGMLIRANSQCIRDVHPLFVGEWTNYGQSVAFDIRANDIWCDYCYSDQFSTGFRFAKGCGGGVYDKCFCFWYFSSPGMRHVAFAADGQFCADINNLTCWFKRKDAVNAVLTAGAPGGCGLIRDTRVVRELVTDPRDVRLTYSVR